MEEKLVSSPNSQNEINFLLGLTLKKATKTLLFNLQAIMSIINWKKKLTSVPKNLVNFLLWLILIISVIHFSSTTLQKTDKNFYHISDLDGLEYHTIALNIARGHGFPIMGFVDSSFTYKIDLDTKDIFNSQGLQAFKENGPITYFSKPPVYPIVLSIVYKINESKPIYLYLFYLLVILLSTVLIVNISFLLIRNEALSLLAGILFVTLKLFYVKAIGPEPLALFILLLIIRVHLINLNAPSYKKMVFCGVLCCLLLLTKGSYLFFVMMILSHYFISLFISKKTKAFFLFSAFLAGFSLLLLSWIGYANYAQEKVRNEQLIWKQNIIEKINKNKAHTDSINIGNLADNYPILNDQVINHLYSRYINDEEKFIVLTNQVQGDEILAVHNERMVEAYWYVHWKLDTLLFHNNYYQDASPIKRVVMFYKDQPKYISMIANTKYRLASTGLNYVIWIYVISYILFTLFTIKNGKIKTFFLISIIGGLLIGLSTKAPLFSLFLLYCLSFGFHYFYRSHDKLTIINFAVLNSLLIVFLFCGDPRFMIDISGICFIATIFIYHSFFTKKLEKSS